MDWDCVAWDVGSLNAALDFASLAKSEPEGQSSGSRELLAARGVSRVRVEEVLAAVRKMRRPPGRCARVRVGKPRTERSGQESSPGRAARTFVKGFSVRAFGRGFAPKAPGWFVGPWLSWPVAVIGWHGFGTHEIEEQLV